MNLTMADGVEQYPVCCAFAATVGSPDDVMVVPSGQFGDLLLTDWAEAVLLLPQVKQLPPCFEIIGHFDIEPVLKVHLPGGIVRIRFTFELDVTFDRHIGCME